MYYIFRETICKNWFEVFIILITLIFILLPELEIPFTDFDFSNLIIPLLPTIYFFLNKKTFLEKIKIFKEEIVFAIIFFIYLMLLGLLISPYPKTSLFYTVKLLEFLPVFILSLFLFEHKESFYLLILLISILLGIINIILFFFPTLYQTFFHERLFTYPRMQSLIGHPNPYGFAILIFILISFILFENKLISLTVFLLSYIFNSFNLFLTGSKNNFFMFLALSIFIIYEIFKNDKKVIGITLLIYLIFLSFLFYIFWIKTNYNLWLKIINLSSRPSFLQNEEKIINRIKELTYYQITTFNFRKELYKRAIETIKNHPLGVGPYVFQVEILKRDKFIVEKFGEKRVKSSHAHNIILQMWLDFGIFNFLFIFGLIYLTLNFKSYLKLYWLMILLANIVDYFLTNIFILYLTIIILGFSLSELKYEKNIN
jgi:O-antigen ligase